jgi:hypothetical protein
MNLKIKILSLTQAATAIQRCRGAVYHAIRTGSLKAELIGEQWVVQESDLKDYISRRSQGLVGKRGRPLGKRKVVQS